MTMVRKRKQPAAPTVEGAGQPMKMSRLLPVGGVLNDENTDGANAIRLIPQFCMGLLTLSSILANHLEVSGQLFFEAFAGSCRLTMGVMMARVAWTGSCSIR